MIQVSVCDARCNKVALTVMLDAQPKLRGEYEIDQIHNIITITLPSGVKKSILINLFNKLQYETKEYFVHKCNSINMLHVYDMYRPLRHSFRDFMTKCYNPDSASADLAIVVNQWGQCANNVSDKQKDIMKSITYEQKVTKKFTLNFHAKTSKDLVVYLNRKFKKNTYKGKF